MAPFENRPNTNSGGDSVPPMEKEFSFIPVPAESVPIWWEKVEALYKATPETWADYESLENIYYQHLSGHRLLFIAVREFELYFAMSGKVQIWTMGKIIQMDWCAGKDTAKFMALALSTMEGLATQIDAFEVQFIGREGWKPLLAPYGYKVSHTIYSKRLDGVAPRRS